MAIEAKTEEELNEIRGKIRRARAFARKHFNVNEAHKKGLFDENGKMRKPAFFMNILDPDKIQVTPSLMGQEARYSYVYRLHFRKDELVWIMESGLGYSGGARLAPKVVVPGDFEG